MITLKNKDLRGLLEALARLSRERFNQQTAYQIGRMYQVLDKANQVLVARMRMAHENYGKRDADGKLVVNEYKEVQFQEEHEAKAHAELSELFEKEFTVDRLPLPIESLTCGLSPKEILALEPILSGLDEFEKADQNQAS